MEFDIDRTLDAAAKAGVEHCDVRMEASSGLNLEMRDRTVEKAVHGSQDGVAVRVLKDGAWGFFSTNQVMSGPELVEQALKNAMVVAGGDAVLAPVEAVTGEVRLPVSKDPADVPIDEKVSFLRDLADSILDVEKASSVAIIYDDGIRDVHIAGIDGTDVRSQVTRTMVQANVTARDGSEMVGYRLRVGGTQGFEMLDDEVLEAGAETARRAVALLSADHPPSGTYPMITDPELTGVFVHEAVGHAVEADLVTTGGSILEGRLGEEIGDPSVNIYDDPTIPGAFGSFPFDQEGIRGKRKDIIVDGKLVDFINSRETAARLGIPVNGGSRAMSYGVRPLVRMSNTMMGPGDMSLEELIEGIKYGVLAKGTRGGTVDTEKGTFQFSASEAHLIERGEMTAVLRDVSFTGDVLGTLRDVEGMTKETVLGQPGFCGKGDMQIVPVGDGGPFVRFKSVMIGGR
jgi:TldD protein